MVVGFSLVGCEEAGETGDKELGEMEEKSVVVEYEVDGTFDGPVLVSWNTTDGGTTSESVSDDWTKKYEKFPVSTVAGLSVSSEGSSADLGFRILVDGSVRKEKSVAGIESDDIVLKLVSE